jgi:hypothetical protein
MLDAPRPAPLRSLSAPAPDGSAKLEEVGRLRVGLERRLVFIHFIRGVRCTIARDDRRWGFHGLELFRLCRGAVSRWKSLRPLTSRRYFSIGPAAPEEKIFAMPFVACRGSTSGVQSPSLIA